MPPSSRRRRRLRQANRRDLHEPDEPMIAGIFVGIVRRDFDVLLCSQKDKLCFQCRPGRQKGSNIERGARRLRKTRALDALIENTKGVYGSTSRQTDSGPSYLYATASRQPYLSSRFLCCWRRPRSYCLRPIVVGAEAWATGTKRLGSRHLGRQVPGKCRVP